MSRRWRVGRSLGRTLYWQVGAEPSKDDVFVGIMDTVGLAAQVAAACNGATRPEATDHDPLCRQQHWDGGDCFDCRLIAKVRDNEREAIFSRNQDALNEEMVDSIRDRAMADLRAKVEALLPERPQQQYLSGWDAALADVLALIDGTE